MSKTYFGKDGELLVFAWQFLAGAPTNADILLCPCVDCHHDEPYSKFGMFTNERNRWQHIPLEELPRKFVLTLMLMDVSL